MRPTTRAQSTQLHPFSRRLLAQPTHVEQTDRIDALYHAFQVCQRYGSGVGRVTEMPLARGGWLVRGQGGEAEESEGWPGRPMPRGRPDDWGRGGGKLGPGGPADPAGRGGVGDRPRTGERRTGSLVGAGSCRRSGGPAVCSARVSDPAVGVTDRSPGRAGGGPDRTVGDLRSRPRRGRRPAPNSEPAIGRAGRPGSGAGAPSNKETNPARKKNGSIRCGSRLLPAIGRAETAPSRPGLPRP